MKKRYIIIGLCLLVVLCIVLIILSSREAPPPDVSDLALETHVVPDAENAFTYFMAAAAHMSADTRASVELYLTDDETEHDDDVGVLASNVHVLASVEAGLRCEHYVGTPMSKITDTAEHIMDFRALARHMVVAAKRERSQGHYVEAAEGVTATLLMAERIVRRPESIIEYLVGLANTSIALEEAVELAQTPDIPEAVLTALADAIATHEGAAVAGLIRASKCEFRFSGNVIKDMKSGGLGATAGLFGGLPVPKRLQSGRIPNHLLRSGETQTLFANVHRAAISNAALNRAQMDLGAAEAAIGRVSPVGPMDFLQPNAIGKILVALMLPASDTFVLRRVDATARIRSVRTLVALNRYRLANGALPDTLDALIPAYLAEVPMDPYDGEPIRYRPEANRIYTVGNDLKDDGGSLAVAENTGRSRREHRDSRRDICWGITQPLDFTAALNAEQP